MISYNLPEIERALALLFEPGDVAEVRIPDTSRATVSGYFDDIRRLAQAAIKWSGVASAVYVTLNPVNSTLLARSVNRLTEYAKHTTSDTDILCRRWLPLDFDPIRVAGISSSNEEHEVALKRATEVQAWLKGLGWPESILADSGNGGHLLHRIDLPNTTETTALIQRCLKAVALKFGDTVVEVDLTIGNPARIWKLYGTKACKGDDTPERRHRLAKILDVPNKIQVVSRELVEQLAAMAPDESKADRTSTKNSRGPLKSLWRLFSFVLS